MSVCRNFGVTKWNLKTFNAARDPAGWTGKKRAESDKVRFEVYGLSCLPAALTEVCVLNSIKIYLPCTSKALECIFFRHIFSQLHIFNAMKCIAYFSSTDATLRLARLPQAYRRREIWLLQAVDIPENVVSSFLTSYTDAIALPRVVFHPVYNSRARNNPLRYGKQVRV
ncbi:hypothetical protein ALC62_05461 [Cyphomyrmex costatus]|uniref:Uncharacterized protein n=1 Tax=Cyphomyrmex costatus TaxID=456900 RepID=A0A195CUE7_9HYME|nr:hypothetical protein ALC62_05461 [Cyphomyrmex costatus]